MYRIGRTVAKFPVVTLIVVAAIGAGLSSGIPQLQVTDNPLELWSSKDSRYDFTLNNILLKSD